MAITALAKRWGIKPSGGAQLQSGQSLANGLVFCCIPQSGQGGGSGTPFDIVSNEYGIRVGSPTSKINRLGVGFGFSIGPDLLEFDVVKRIPTGAPLTVVALGGWDRVSTVSKLCSLVQKGTGNFGWNLAYEMSSSTNQVGFTKRGTADVLSGLACPVGPSMIAASVTSSTVTFFVNGKIAVISDSNTISTGADEFVIGAQVLGVDACSGTTNAVFVWNRALSTTELFELFVDPYRCFQQTSAMDRFLLGRPTVPIPPPTPLSQYLSPKYAFFDRGEYFS